MKKIAFITAALAITTACFAQPRASFKDKTYDFGTIKEEKGNVSHVFEFKNTGDKALIIVDAVSSCGCTTPSYTTQPVKPGKSGKITVQYNPKGRRGSFRKSVKVKTNGEERVSTLVITGTVVPKAR